MKPLVSIIITCFLSINGDSLFYIGCLIRSSAFLITSRSDPELLQEEWDMFLNLATCGPFVSDKKITVCYRRHGNNTWFRSDREKMMYLSRMQVLDVWQQEKAWPQVMDLRWQQYTHNSLLSKEDVDNLLRERLYDSLQHFLKSKFSMQNSKTAEALIQVSMAILHCAGRLNSLIELYKIEFQATQDDKEKLNVMREMKLRLSNN